MSSEIEKIEERLRKIEEDLIAERAARAANRKWATTAGLGMLAWLGITSFIQIPKAVDQSNTGQFAREAEGARDRAVKAAAEISQLAADPPLRVEQGTISVPSSPGTPLRDGPDGVREVGGYFKFDSPYKDAATVHCFLRKVDITGGTRYEISAKVRPDRSGFDWKFHTWADTRLYRCELDWLAIGK